MENSNTNVEKDSLDQLQSREQVELLDAIDNLRSQGLGQYDINLPQLIVCGEQSAGKSAVLAGLTRLRFPTQDGLCTTFATELILRKNETINISCSITPGKDRSQAERNSLLKFKQSFASAEIFDFPRLIEQARKCMSFGAESREEFFDDILQIQYSGPDVPSLTIVDLPGIIQFTRAAPKSVKTVQGIVQGYMANKNSIILAVVPAHTDLENQGILSYAKAVDPLASRTMGIITKPDKLDPTSEAEKKYIALASNSIVRLNHGWHVIKNRGFGMDELSDDERDQSESEFFATGSWTSLPRSDVGIDSLRVKLSKVLLQHIWKELPSLNATLHEVIAMTETNLRDLGSPRDELHQQLSFLMGKAQRFQTHTIQALRGMYSDPFFAVSDPNIIPPTRLRTMVHDLNLAFAQAMFSKGHKYCIVDDGAKSDPALSSASHKDAIQYAALPEPIDIERSQFMDEHIGMQVRLSRPSGLPSLVNPWVIGEVFRKQAEPWGAIARQHLNDTCEAVSMYLYESLSHMVDTDTFVAMMVEHVTPELDKRRALLQSKLDEVLTPYLKHEPIIYDPSFIEDLEKIRAKRYFQSRPQFAFGSTQSCKPASAPTQLLTESMDDFTNCEILNLMNAYYQRAISVFINNVTVLAIENCLISNLPSLLDSELVLNLDEDKLRAIASESDEIRAKRAALTQKLQDLRAGKRIMDSQTRHSVKVARGTSHLRRAMPPRDVSPVTPAPQAAPLNPYVNDQIADLTSGIDRITVTTPRGTARARTTPSPDLLPMVPLTPPKTPRMQRTPTPRCAARAESVTDTDDEY